MVLSLLVGVKDGFCLAMFILLLQMVDAGSAPPDSSNLGEYVFLVDIFSYLVFDDPRGGSDGHFHLFAMKGGLKFAEGYLRVINEQLFIRKIRRGISGACLISAIIFLSIQIAAGSRIPSAVKWKGQTGIPNYFMSFSMAFLWVYIFMVFLPTPVCPCW